MTSSSGIRDIARFFKVSPTTVTNRISRLARQSLAVHTELIASLSLKENLVADGFESFAVSQYFPNNITILAGKESQFWIGSDYAHLKRKGRMTSYQQKKNRKLQDQFRAGRRSIYRSFNEIVRLALDCTGTHHTTLYTDEHTQYKRVIGELNREQSKRLAHVTISSKLPRTVRNHLFSVNYLDREIRKDCAAHTRETVQFSRNVSNCMERMAVYRLYHNYMKPFRIGTKEGEKITHGEKAGIERRLIDSALKSLFTRRRMYSRVRSLSLSDTLVWLRGIATPLKQVAEFLPGYAYA